MKWRKVMKASHPRQVYRSAKAHPTLTILGGLLLASNAAWGIQYDTQSHAVKFVWGPQERAAVAAQIEATKQVERRQRREELRQFIKETIREEC
jgi:hypothetical protein